MKKPFALVIEDDPKLGVILETSLRQAGYDTALDSRGDQFMEKLAIADPTIIFLDLHLPYASGIDILRQIRSDERCQKASVVVTTADLFLAKSLQDQAEYVLLKPVSVGHLLDLARKLHPDNAVI